MDEHKHGDKLELVQVYLSNGPLGAEVVKAKLESVGIPVLLRSEAQSVFPMTIDGMGEVAVMVPQEHAAAALELLQEQEVDDEEDDDEDEEEDEKEG